MSGHAQSVDRRVKAPVFPVSAFVATVLAFAVLTTVQMRIIGSIVDVKRMSAGYVAAVVAVWFVSAGLFALLVGWQMRRFYHRPLNELSHAARRIASGDFSVRLTPRHTSDRLDSLDVLYEDFNTMARELSSVETLKTEFFSNVSHEFKTPLAIIQNNAEMLDRPALGEEQRRESTKAILRASQRLNGLIGNMLKLNRLENQAIQPTPKAYDLDEQLCECAVQFDNVLDDKRIDFEADLEDRTPITADRELLELVWTNLLSNAIKFTPDGGSIRLRQTSDERSVTVTVTDTGCGMDEATAARIFEKFYQADTSHATEGNGLGLALAKRVIDLHHGRILVDSTPDAGSTFTVTLPRT